MKTKDMIKILKAINKRKRVERRFKSAEYNYVWEDCEDNHSPNFTGYEYRIKNEKVYPKICIAKMINTFEHHGFVYYLVVDNKELAARVEETFADFDCWVTDFIESVDAEVDATPVYLFWTPASRKESPKKIDVKISWGL